MDGYNMNKETIKYYKKEFEHWLNGGKLLSSWSLDSVPMWRNDKENSATFFTNPIGLPIYIIDDEYVELRKAEAEGKIIELNDGSEFCPNWNRAFPDKTSFDIYPLQCYRIKPYPNFKIGDWIQHPDDYIFQFKKEHINDIHLFTYEYKLWKPKYNEWCVFWNNNKSNYTITHFDRKDKHIYPYITKYGYGRYQNIAPLEFIQTLKEKNE